MKEGDRSMGDGLFSQIAGAAVTAPVAIGLTALGAMVSLTQWMFAAVSSLLPGLGSARPRHNAARVSEQLQAAKRAARASGVLWSHTHGLRRRPERP